MQVCVCVCLFTFIFCFDCYVNCCEMILLFLLLWVFRAVVVVVAAGVAVSYQGFYSLCMTWLLFFRTADRIGL